MTDTVAADQLRSIVTRIENVEAEIKELNEGKSEIYSEAKANGWDVKVIKRIVADRRKPAAEREEFEAILELYLDALGMPVAAEPRAPAREARDRRAKARMSESMADHKEFSAELEEAGLISPEAHAENLAIADGVARKFGNGVRA